MKKIFSIFAALLFAGSMFAAEALNTNFTSGQGAWTINDVSKDVGLSVVWQNNMSYGMKASGYYNKTYYGCESWLISPKIDLSEATTATLTFSHALNFGTNTGLSVVIKAAGDEKWTALNVAWPAGNNWTFIDASTSILSFAGKSDVQIAFVFTSTTESSPTWEIKTVAVTYETESGGGGEELKDPTNCAEAREAALSVSGNNVEYNGGKSYTITGYVTSIAYAWSDKKMSFWMADTKTGGEVLEAYQCAIENKDDAPGVGDKVAVTGVLTKYGTTPEFKKGCTCEILEKDVPAINLGEKTIAEFLSLKNTKDTCILKGIVENIQMDKDDDTKYNAYGNFDLTDLTGSVYIYGLLTPDGESKKFIEMGIEPADTVIVKAIYAVHGDDPQVVNAILVEHIKPTAITPVYSYDYEPTEVSSFDLTLDYMFGSSYDTENHIVTIMLGDNSDMDKAENFVVLDFILDGYDSESGLPDGVYGISFVGNDATCVASIGGTDDDEMPSYFGTIPTGETGYIPYYLVDGTVTINGNKITVDATSYNGSTIKLTYEEVVIPDLTTCAEAADAALSVSEDHEEYNGGKEYSITGYVTSIANAWDKTKITFWMADAIEYGDVLEAFQCAIADAANVPNYGDKVTVTGKLTKYGSIPEFKSGCTCVIVETGTVTLPDPTTCSEAAEYVLKYISKNDDEYNGGLEYKLTGYVTAIEEEYLAAKGNLSFWLADTEDGGNVLEAFRCVPESEDKLPKIGDKVEVTGKLTRYGTKAEFAKGCTCVIKEESAPAVNLGPKTIGEFLTLKNIKDTCVLTGIVKNIVIDEKTSKPSVYGNFDLEDSTGKVFIYGLLTADGQKQKFLEMDIEENDELILKAIYHDTGSKVEAVNAIYVSHKKASTTAIDNTDEAVKAIKTFENGQLVIIKNGVKYNATGAVIR